MNERLSGSQFCRTLDAVGARDLSCLNPGNGVDLPLRHLGISAAVQ